MNPWELHPAVVHLPLAFLLAAAGLDLVRLLSGDRRPSAAAASLLVAGVALGLVSAALGVVAFRIVPAHTDQAHRMMYWHAGLAAATLLVLAPVAAVRWRERHRSAPAWTRVASIAGALLIGATGWLGGYLILRGAAGVDPALLAAEIRTGHSHADKAAEGQHGDRAHDHAHGPVAPAAPAAPAAPPGAPVRAPAAPEHPHAPGAPAHEH